jgi:hypothetical protein
MSPDAKYLSYLAPSKEDGVYNIFIKTLPAPGAAPPPAGLSLFAFQGTDRDRRVTDDKLRGISNYQWTEDGTGILYIQDKNGDEQNHLYYIPLSAVKEEGKPPAPVDLTPFPGVKAAGIRTSKRFPDVVFIGLNRRAPERFDMYRLDLPTRKLTLEMVNPGGITGWMMDYDFKIRVGLFVSSPVLCI